MNDTQLALDALFTRYLNLYTDEKPALPHAKFQTSWPSECVIESGKAEGDYYWKPKKREANFSFSDLEESFELSFHQDIHDFYGTFWSNGIAVERDDINFSLIQIWNSEDEAQLKENMLGHVFAKIKSKLPITFFIGCTFGDEIIALDNETGEIILEKPGYKGHKVLAKSLASFLVSLNPLKDSYNT